MLRTSQTLPSGGTPTVPDRYAIASCWDLWEEWEEFPMYQDAVGQARRVNGQNQTRASTSSFWGSLMVAHPVCDSGWVNGTEASCVAYGLGITISARHTSSGVSVSGLGGASCTHGVWE